MWESRVVGEISKRCGTGGKPLFGFPRVPWRVISTALRLRPLLSRWRAAVDRSLVSVAGISGRCSHRDPQPIAPQNLELVQRLAPVLYALPFRGGIAERQVQQLDGALFIRE